MNPNQEKPLPDFIIDAPATIEWPVRVEHPVDGGELAAFEFVGVFKRLAEADFDRLLPELEAADPEAAPVQGQARSLTETLEENAGVFAQVLQGWRGPRNADGTPADFTPERLRAVTTGPNGAFFSAGIWRALAEIRHGARLGN
jgi:hypothetical protein